MNKIQQLSWQYMRSMFADEDLLLEALLRRGFLAYRDEEGIWLGTGSHTEDVSVLKKIPQLIVEDVAEHTNRLCKITVSEHSSKMIEDAAQQIVALGEHHVGSGHGGFTAVGFGVALSMQRPWRQYKAMQWGAKLPVCPARNNIHSRVQNALDTGTALLVKALPLARVATYVSCDGHGIKPAEIGCVFTWDHCWANAVFHQLPFKPMHSIWTWTHGLQIEPTTGYDDASLTLMLEDIQQCARQLLCNETITCIESARRKAILATDDKLDVGPSEEVFSAAAATALREYIN